MRTAEKAIWALAALVATALLGWFSYRTGAMKHQDTAFLFEGVQSILDTGRPVSFIVSSWTDVYRSFSMTAAAVCASALGFSGQAPFDLLSLHAYTALYPIAGLAAVFGVEPTFAALHALAYAGLVFLPCLYLRRAGHGVIASAAFGLLVMAYPGWSLSAGGDYYLDRLYMPCMLALLYLLDRQAGASGQVPPATGPAPRTLAPLLLVAALAALCSERAAIMVLGALGYFLAAYPPLRTRWRLYLILIGLLLAYLAVYFAAEYQGAPGSPSLLAGLAYTPAALLQKLRNPALSSFLATNFLFLGLFALLAPPRILLLLLGAMAPNLLLGMGGAELNGWSSHYHAMYIPFLVYAASVGYGALLRRLPPALPRWAAAAAAVAAVALLARYFDPYTGRWDGSNTSPSRHWGVASSVLRFFAAPASSGEKAVSDWARTLAEHVPPGASVSAVEGAMPALYRSRLVSFYPVGLDSADYLVISGRSKDGVVTDTFGAVTYLPGANGKELNACLQQRLAAQGFVLVQDVTPISMLVLRRQQRPPA